MHSTTTKKIYPRTLPNCGTVTSHEAHRARLRRRRLIRDLVFALEVIAVAAAIMVAAQAILWRAMSAATPTTWTTYTVRQGDTLWQIAERVAPDRDPRDVVDAIRRLKAAAAA